MSPIHVSGPQKKVLILAQKICIEGVFRSVWSFAPIIIKSLIYCCVCASTLGDKDFLLHYQRDPLELIFSC